MKTSNKNVKRDETLDNTLLGGNIDNDKICWQDVLYQFNTACNETQADPDCNTPCGRGRFPLNLDAGVSRGDYEFSIAVTRRDDEIIISLNSYFEIGALVEIDSQDYFYVKQVLENPYENLPFIPLFDVTADTEISSRLRYELQN